MIIWTRIGQHISARIDMSAGDRVMKNLSNEQWAEVKRNRILNLHDSEDPKTDMQLALDRITALEDMLAKAIAEIQGEGK
ncbi:MAG: hypothetical protein Unbinned7794contig1000_23 [Prokaryotic dsDNA virus sp.]|nr:MAG: hypothetical protein Unbinned7794contig1000_23 [Prokaryotic dsDNA virus sp.]|tara:strand:+ start:7162 stop:7401 length:240 start_codon:yes stop_codon:yes gene_type:complete